MRSGQPPVPANLMLTLTSPPLLRGRLLFDSRSPSPPSQFPSCQKVDSVLQDLLLKEKPGIIFFFNVNSPCFQVFQFRFLRNTHRSNEARTTGPDVAPGPAVCKPCSWSSLSLCTSPSGHGMRFLCPQHPSGSWPVSVGTPCLNPC